jgi:hypothetical protein
MDGIANVQSIRNFDYDLGHIVDNQARDVPPQDDRVRENPAKAFEEKNAGLMVKL